MARASKIFFVRQVNVKLAKEMNTAMWHEESF
jgi:hypothetical protein